MTNFALGFSRTAAPLGWPVRKRTIIKSLLVVKLTIILLTAFLLSAHAGTRAQQVTISGANLTYEQIFDLVEKQTGYVVFGNRELIGSARKMSLEVKNMPLRELLAIVLKNQPFEFMIDDKTIFISRKPGTSNGSDRPAPPIVIRVTDSLGNPLANATVAVRHKKVSGVTNGDGRLSIPVFPGDILTISFVGMETRTIVVSGAMLSDGGLNVTLRPSVTNLKNVEVVYNSGYQSISRERATGSYDVIGQEVLGKRPVSNLSSALEGMVAGMQGKENADGSVSFLIRGSGTLYGETRPLVVVDGFPVSDIDFSTINPNDVLTVTVLKDAAAASIWGARASNGVIVITTKKPRTGKLTIGVNAFTRISNYTDLNHVLNQANSSDQVNYERLAWERNIGGNFYNGSFSHVIASLSLATEYMQKRKTGAISEEQLNAGLDSLRKISNRRQLKDHLQQRAILTQANLTVSGATERSQTYASLMYENARGGMIKNGYNRFNLNFNNQYQPARFLTFSVGGMLQYREDKTGGPTVFEMQSLSPYETLLKDDGSYSVNLRGYNREQLSKLPLDKFPYSDWTYNLLREVRGRDIRGEDLSARVQAGVNIRLFKGLAFDAKVQYERRKIENETYLSEETFEARDAVNIMAKYNQASRRADTFYLPKGGILKTNNSDAESYVIRNQLTFDRLFNSRHSVTAIAGMEVSQYTMNTRVNPWAYGYNPDRLTTSLPPFGYGSALDPLRNFRNFVVSTIPGGNTTLGWYRDRFVSYYANAGYTYLSKYSISGSIRSDASNYITKDPALRWSPLWSVGAMWNLQREAFFKQASFVDDLRLRLTYGKNGNAEKSTSTEALITPAANVSPVTGTVIASLTPGNPSLRWEKTTTTNLGIDFALFRRRLSGKVDLYHKMGTDITGTVNLPTATGVRSQRFNNAKVLNKGVEVELGTALDISKSVKYSTVLTYAFNHNRIKDLYRPNMYAWEMLESEFEPQIFVEGRPVSARYSFLYNGQVDGTPTIVGPGGKAVPFNDVSVYNSALGAAILQYEGTGIPPHTLGWLHSFNVRDFYVTGLFLGKFGGRYRNVPFNYQTGVGFGKPSFNAGIAEVFAGNPDIPPFPLENNTRFYLWDRYAPYLNTYVENSSFIECKEVSLGYNLPARLIGKAGMQSAKLYLQARNLGLVWAANRKGYHPEWLPGSIRPPATFMIGANVQF